MKRILISLLTVTAGCVIYFALPAHAFAANLYWVGNDAAATNVATNWKTTDPSGCGGGDASAAPGTSDVAIFDADCDNGAAITGSFSVQGVNMNSGYTGTVTQNAVTMTIGSSGWTQAGGTFTGNSDGSTANITIQSGGDMNLTGGTFTSTNDTLTETDDWTINGGTFTANSGTLKLQASADNAQTITGSFTASALYLNDIACANYNITIASGTTVTVSGTLTFDGTTSCDGYPGTLNGPGGISAQGDITALTDGWNGTGVITVNGTGTQTLTGVSNFPTALAYVPAIDINKGSGSITLTNTITASDNFTNTSGTELGGTGTLAVSPTTDNSGTITTSFTAPNLYFYDPGACAAQTITIASGTTITVTGTTTLNGNDTCVGLSTLNGPGGVSSQGDITVTGDGWKGTAVFTVNGTGTQTLTGISDFPTNAGLVPAMTVNKSSGSITLTNTLVIADDFTNSSGTALGGTGTLAINAITDASATITGSFTAVNVYFYDPGDCAAQTITIASGTTITVTGTTTLNGNDTCVGLSTLNGPGGVSSQGDITVTGDGWKGTAVFTVNGTGTQTLTGISDFPTNAGLVPAMTVNKSSGSITLTSTISISNDFTNTSETNFGGTGTLAFYPAADASMTITNSFSAPNMYIYGNSCSGTTITFASGTTVTVTGTTNWKSESCNSYSMNGPGTLALQGDISVTNQGNCWGGNVAITLSGSNNQTLTGLCGTNGFPTGTFTVNKPSGTVTLGANFLVNASGQDLLLSQGTLDMSTYNLTVNDSFSIGGTLTQGTGNVSAGTYTISRGGTWNNPSTGDITVGSGGVTNNGTINFGSLPLCGASDSIAITSSSGGTARTWTGSGQFNLYDVTVTDQNETPKRGRIAAYSSTNSSNSNWNILSSCTQEPQGYWKFDEGQGSATQDSTNNNNDGSISGASWQTEDKCVSGKCLNFDGTDDVVTVTNNSEIDLNNDLAADFSISAWISPDSDGEGDTGQIYQKGTNTYLRVDNQSGTSLDVEASLDLATTDATLNISAPITTNIWHHIEVTYADDSDDEISIYIDGVLRGTSTDGSGAPEADTSDLLIGGTTTANFDGRIDDFKIYPYARTAAQIKQDYLSAVKNAGTKIGASGVLGAKTEDYLSQGLVGYWKMDDSGIDAEGEAITDSSGKGNTGTLYGDNGVGDNGSGMTCTASGKFGTGCQFDGTDDYVQTATTTFVATNGTSHSAFAWVYPTNTTPLQSAWSYGEYDDSAYTTALGINNGKVVWMRDGSSGVESSTLTIPANQWSFIGFVRTQGKVEIWLNGSSETITSSGTARNDVMGNDPYLIGVSSRNSTKESYFNGSIDQIRVYNRALSPQEVRNLYNFAPGPVGYWRMDERSGTTINDSSGNTYVSSAFTGNASWTNGKFGGGLSFDGDGDVVRIAEGTYIDLGATTDSYTVEGWIKTTTNYSGNATVVAKDDGSGAYPFELYLNGSEYACFQISDGTNSPSVCGSTALNDGKWHYLTGKRSVADDKIYILVDGVEINSATDTTTATAVNNDDVSIGNAGTSYVANDFNGSIDDVKIYNYARTQKQIVEDMNASHPAVGSPVGSPVAHWKLDEGYSTTAYDSTPNANNLTLSSASWTNSGKYGKAWNGTGALWLSKADDSDFDVSDTDDYSVSLWFKSDSATNPSATEYLFNKANATTAGYAVYAKTDGTLCFGIDDDTSWGPDISSCSTTDLYDGNWHNIVAVRDYSSSDKTYIYIDGIVRDSDSDTTSATLANALSLYIGDRDGTDNGDEFNGDLDEIKIYRYALTSDEVKTEYNRGQSLVLGALSDNSTYQKGAANQEYCIPGDSTSCAAPVGEWKFEEGRGTSANDTSGNGNAGTLGGDGSGTDLPVWSNGKYGKGLSFDGSDDYIDMGDPSSGSLDMGTSSITISAWVKTNSATNQTIVSKRNSGTGSTGYRFRISSSGNLLATMTDVSTNQVDPNTSSVNIVDNKWHYVTVVLNRTTNLASFYVDGIASTVSAADLSGVTGSVSNAINFRVGYTPDNLQPFNGRIDQIHIFNYARSAAQIAWDYNRGNPVGWWKLDECQGSGANSAKDSSGNSYHGNITIGASGDNSAAGTCTSSGAWYNGVSGKRNYSLDLGGTDDYITVTDTANLRFDANTSDFSLFAWVKRTTTGTEYIISKEDADNDGYRMLFTSSNTVQCSEDATDVTSTSTIADTNWHLIGCTIDRDGNGQVYIDGRLDGSAAAMGTDAMATTSNITLGTRSYTSTSYFNGQIDDVRIYNYSLTGAQVKGIYNEGAVRFGPLTGSP